MPSPDPNYELISLLDQQICALEKQLFGVVTELELREYESRRERICELYNQIMHSRAA